jgi:siroheme synthase
LTPAAVIFGAGTAAADVWTMTLGELQRGIEPSDSTLPGTVVIGEVVRLRAAIAFDATDCEAAAR